MRWLLLTLLLVTLLGLALLSLPPGYAQDFPPTATPPFQVVGLPFSESFDAQGGWFPEGAWRFDPRGGVEGGAWRLDGTVRGATSTLTYLSGIDLHGTLSAQLLYRVRGALPASDLVAVELSLDGGRTWFMIDTEVGVRTADWEGRVIDLTYYRGQVIRLRFRVSAGATGSAVPRGAGYRLDNVTIQYVTAPEEMISVPVDPTPRTLMGLHLTLGSESAPVLDLVHALQSIGWPLGTLKGVTGTEGILNAVAQDSPNTIIVYRSLETASGPVDCPDASGDPVRTARAWVEGLQPYWTKVQADYYELMNECHPPAAWLVPFTTEAMAQAAARGQCLLVFSFAAGNPEPAEFAALQPVFEYALANPCQPGRTHGIALHAYGIQPQTLLSQSGLSLGLRHRLLLAQLLPTLPQAILLPVFITEAGAGDGRASFDCAAIAQDVIQYTRDLEFDPYVRGFHLWTVAPQGSEWFNVTPCLPQVRDALLSYYQAKPRR